MKWRPIATAPRDERKFLATNGQRASVTWWYIEFNPLREEWTSEWSHGHIDRVWAPTHWMPIAAPPK